MRPATFIPSEYRVPSPNTGINLSHNRPLLYPSTSFDFSESGDQPLLPSRSSHPSRPSVYPAPLQCCGECWSHNIVAVSPFSELEATIRNATFVDRTYHFIQENGYTLGSFIFSIFSSSSALGPSATAGISAFLRGKCRINVDQIVELWYNHSYSYSNLVGKGTCRTMYSIPSYAHVKGESMAITDLDATGSRALLDNWVLRKALHTLDEEGRRLSQHKFGLEGIVRNWEAIALFSPSAIQASLQCDAPFTWSALVTMGTNSDQRRRLDAVTDETLSNGEFDDDEDHWSSASDDNGERRSILGYGSVLVKIGSRK
jgi:hypothetical protein